MVASARKAHSSDSRFTFGRVEAIKRFTYATPSLPIILCPCEPAVMSTRRHPKDPEALASGVMAGERRALAKAITLIESSTDGDRALAGQLLQRLKGSDSVAMRIGLSGTPGVGKSTFIEALGMELVGQGHRVAVLAVDPSSSRSGGSILGDKTRMERLSRHPAAFIRPSPSDGTLGGVARRTRETIRLVEAAGFDVVIVETVGVGQSETLVAEMTDIFLLLLAPAGGDELQGVKRGIMEIADLIVVNKADGDLKPIAETTRTDYAGALHLLRKRSADPEGFPAALTVSARTGDGLVALWTKVLELFRWRQAQDWINTRRAAQAGTAFDRSVEQVLLSALRSDSAMMEHLATLRAAASAGQIDPEVAAAELVARFLKHR